MFITIMSGRIRITTKEHRLKHGKKLVVDVTKILDQYNMNRLPPIKHTHKICVICEGYEDFYYFKRLLEFNVWNEVYDFHLINAKSASNIPAHFQYAYQNNRYEIILVFCDTDKAPYREYSKIKMKINSFLNKQKAAEKLIIFANPCTMQIILLHFGNVSLKNHGKGTNSKEIENLTGVKNYDAHEEQIKEICNKIFRKSYDDMHMRVEKINSLDTTSGSTNL